MSMSTNSLKRTLKRSVTLNSCKPETPSVTHPQERSIDMCTTNQNQPTKPLILTMCLDLVAMILKEGRQIQKAQRLNRQN